MVSDIKQNSADGAPVSADSVKRTVELVNEFLHREYGHIPIFLPTVNRFESSAWITAIENPRRPLELQKNLVLIPLWIFTVDDLIDGHAWPEPQLKARLHHYQAIVQGQSPPDPADPLAGVLGRICRCVSAGPLFGRLGSRWRDSYVRMIRAMIQESYLKPIRDLAFAEYMEEAQFSIGVPTYTIATWIVGSEYGFSDEADTLDQLLLHASWSIRLANDLRTVDKEWAEHNGNVVAMLQRQRLAEGANEDRASSDAVQFVRDRLNQEVDAVRRLAQAGPRCRHLARLTEATVGLYQVGDFHTMGLSQLLSSMD